MQTELNLFSYSDFRTFLKDFTDARRKSDPRWSYGVWARQLKLKSSSTLIMVLNGQRNPGPGLLKSLARYFRFTTEQQEYFENLVRLQRAKNDPGLSVLVMEKLASQHAGKGFQFLDQRTFSAISNWHYYAIREMTSLADFDEDPAWISRRLKGKITPGQAKIALRTLLELGLIARNKQGRLTLANGHVDTVNDVVDEGLRRFHEQTLALAKDAVREIDSKQKEISGTTFAIRLEDLPKAKELIRKFRLDLCNLLEKDSAEAVYHLEVAFFPFTTLPESERNLK